MEMVGLVGMTQQGKGDGLARPNVAVGARAGIQHGYKVDYINAN